jgi:hypothetical protein
MITLLPPAANVAIARHASQHLLPQIAEAYLGDSFVAATGTTLSPRAPGAAASSATVTTAHAVAN